MEYKLTEKKYTTKIKCKNLQEFEKIYNKKFKDWNIESIYKNENILYAHFGNYEDWGQWIITITKKENTNNGEF